LVTDCRRSHAEVRVLSALLSSAPTRRLWLISALLGVLIFTAACSYFQTERREVGGKEPEFLPSTAAPSELVEPLGSILILRAYSGPFLDHADRVESALPDVVIFDDGLVVANLAMVSDPPNYVAVQLTDAALDDIVEILETAELEPTAAGGPRRRESVL
jgi:hypothetical protein